MNLPQLTFTRFVAAVLIVVYHFAADKPILQRLGGLERIIYIASTFVSYFFLLSGYILVVTNAKAVALRQCPEPVNFWLNRFARIYPLFFVAFLLAIPSFRMASGAYPTVPAMLTTALLGQAWIPLRGFAINFPDWSLSCEAFFYLLFPFIFRRLVDLSTRWILGVITVVYGVSLLVHIGLVNWGVSRHLVFNDHWFHDFVFHLPLFHLGTFVIGIGFGIVFVRHHTRLLRWAAYGGWLAGVGLAGWLGVVLAHPAALVYHHNGLLTPFYVCILAGLSISNGLTIKILATPPLVWLGEISYGVYILQLPVYWLLSQPWLPTVGGVGGASMYVYVPVLIGLSGISHYFIEMPARRKIRALMKKSLPTPRVHLPAG